MLSNDPLKRRAEALARRAYGAAPEPIRRPVRRTVKRLRSQWPNPQPTSDAPKNLIAPVTGNDSTAPLSGIVLCPMARYHTEELAPLADCLVSGGHRVSILLPSRDWEAVADEMQQYDVPLYAWPSDISTMPDFDAVVLMNDWGDTRLLVELATRRRRPSIAKVEGVQDFRDDDTGRWRYAYQRAEHVLCQGRNDVEALPNALTHIVGSTRLERIFLAEEREFGESRLVVANSNFTYGVLTDDRAQWLGSVADAVADAGVSLTVSQHHADRHLAERLPIADRPMKELLMDGADVLVSRFSTVPYEAMARGVPFIYHNPHGERVPTFASPDGAYDITTAATELVAAFGRALDARGSYRDRSAQFFLQQVDIGSEPSEMRAAEVIDDIVERSRTTRKLVS